MIVFRNHSQEIPFKKLKSFYDEAVLKKQKIVEAISVSSYCPKEKEVFSRYVNLKYVDSNKLIFFSNYNSPKAKQFELHKQVSLSIFWNVTNVQIRMRGIIDKTSSEFNEVYFAARSQEKNALAISSDQSKKINSYDDVVQKYQNTLKSKDLKSCPSYWGGFSFEPYYIEFWQGHESRINKRLAYEKISDVWNEYFLEP